MATPSTWKWNLNFSGYPTQIITVDTSQLKIGDLIPLPHTAFIGASVSAYNNTVKITTAFSPSADVVLTSKAFDLTYIAGTEIFTALSVGTTSAIGQLTISLSFIGDILQASDIGQEVTPTSDVIHNSLVVNSLTSTSSILSTVTVTDNINLPGEGVIAENQTIFDSDTIVARGVSIGKGSISFSGESSLIANEKSILGYDTTTNSWGATDNGETFRSFISTNPQFVGQGLLSLDPNDASKVKSNDFIQIDGEKQGIVTQSVTASSITVGNFVISQINDSLLAIDNSIFIDKTTRTVTIGDLVIDSNFVALVRQMEAFFASQNNGGNS